MNRIVIVSTVCATLASAQIPATFASGLQAPQKITFTVGGSLVVAEGGMPTPNTGRVSIVDSSGVRRSLLEGLPSGPAHFTVPFGPTSTVLDGRTMYLVIGEGDLMAGVPPNYGINANGPSSPIFSSVLRLRFSRELDDIREPFRFERVHHWGIFDGGEIYLNNTAGDQIAVQLLTAFRPYVRNILGGTERVRVSNPMDAALDLSRQHLYVADASSDTLIRIDTATGRATTVYRFEAHRRTNADGPAEFVDVVPTSLCWSGDRLLVGNLSAAFFPAGEAAVRTFDPETRRMEAGRGGFSWVLDVACGSNQRVVAVEFASPNSTAVNTGQVRLVEGNSNRVIATGITPTGVAIHPSTGDIYVSLGTGTIALIPRP